MAGGSSPTSLRKSVPPTSLRNLPDSSLTAQVKPPLMSEEYTLCQSFGTGRAVHRNKFLGGTITRFLNQPRDELFPDPVFSLNPNRFVL